VNEQVRSTHQKRGRSRFGMTMAVPAVVKAAAGALLAVLVVVMWQQYADLENREAVIAQWEDVQDYAIFYPRFVGDDRQELETGGNASTVAEARDLYPVLEEDGALYVEAVNYETGVPAAPSSPWPAPPIRVNDNYLEQYPVLDESGRPIAVADDEQAWVVAVPEQFKARETQLRKYLRTLRSGGPQLVGAVQAEERIVGVRATAQFTHQEVRIIWMASGQEVFSFNSKVNPDRGNMITDPVIEIMTPANSLTVDRLNSITGNLNTALKVRVDGDPAVVLNRLAPALADLELDDNLRHLVSVHEAMGMEVGEVRSGMTWVTAVAIAALIVMLALNATMVIIGSDRLRRKLTVRRLHGVGFVRSYRELFIALGVTWLGQTLLAGAVVVLLEMNSVSMPGVVVNPFAQVPELLAVAAASLVIEALLVVVTANILERRNSVKRLKEF
jgi:hypothetical protein